MARRSKDPQARIEALERQLEQSPSSPAFFPLASLLWQQGDGPRAEKLLRSGLALHPAYAAPRVLLGEILLAMDRPGDAAAELAAAVERAPWNLAGQRLLAESRRREGDEAGARKALRVAAMFDPSDPASRSLLEEAPQLGAPAAAKKGPAPAPQAEAPSPIPTPSLAQLYVAQGHHAQAAEVYRRLLQKEPGNAEWRKQLGLLEARPAGRKEAASRVPAPPEMDLEEELAAAAGGGERKGAGSPAADALSLGDADLDALLAEADEAEAALGKDLPLLPAEDELSFLESPENAGAPGGGAPVSPKADAAPADDLDLESFLAGEDVPAAAAGGEKPSPGTREAAPVEAASGELDLESLFGEEEGEAAGAASSPQQPPAADSASGVILDEELEELLAEDEAGAASSGGVPSGAGVEEQQSPDLDVELELEEEDLVLFPGQAEVGGADEAEAVSAPAAEAPGALQEVDPFLRGIIGLYVEEGSLAQALDICRKASALGPPSPWLAGRMEEIERQLASRAGARLQEFSKADKDGETRPLSPAEVVERLEGWLQALQRRKAKASAGE